MTDESFKPLPFKLSKDDSKQTAGRTSYETTLPVTTVRPSKFVGIKYVIINIK